LNTKQRSMIREDSKSAKKISKRQSALPCTMVVRFAVLPSLNVNSCSAPSSRIHSRIRRVFNRCCRKIYQVLFGEIHGIRCQGSKVLRITQDAGLRSSNCRKSPAAAEWVLKFDWRNIAFSFHITQVKSFR